MGGKIAYAKSITDALNKSQCAIIMTHWKQFEMLNNNSIKYMKKKIIIDCRRILAKKRIRSRILCDRNRKKKMKFVVTGGAGFVGSNLVKLLVNEGHSITVIDNLHKSTKANLEPIIDKIEFHKVDIRDFESLKENLEKYRRCIPSSCAYSCARFV